jgi:molybdopterin synthase sulfur carrier subunit
MKILYFASLRENIGKESEELSGFDDIKALRNYLVKQYPGCFDESIITAVNMEVVHDNVTLTDNDEVAFYPPVTGG